MEEMKIFKITEPVFKTEPLFIIDCSFKRFSKYLKKHYHCNCGSYVGQTGQMFTFKRTPWRVVWVEKKDENVLIHELFHLVTRICQDKGIPIVAQMEHGSGDETAAYLYEFFARRCLKRIR
jgi:hypothetical protein